MGQPALSDDWHHYFPRCDDRRSHGHLRLPRDPATHGPYADPPDAALLTDRSGTRCRHGVCWFLLRLSLGPAAWACRDSAGKPGAGYGHDHAWTHAFVGQAGGDMRGILWLCFGLSGAAAL